MGGERSERERESERESVCLWECERQEEVRLCDLISKLDGDKKIGGEVEIKSPTLAPVVVCSYD